MKAQLAAGACIMLLASHAMAGEKLELKTQKDKLGYAIGLNLGKSLKKNAAEVDPNVIMQRIKDGYAGGKELMTEEQIKETFAAFQQERVEQTKQEGESFLAANKKKDGVITLASGLQYKIIKNGTGKTPKATDSVTVHYRGTLIDGTEFDSSIKRGQPATFNVNGVIPGWTEALQLMKEGAKWQLFIPSNLAYGPRGAGDVIGPNSALIFDVELISISKSEGQQQQKQQHHD
jgi:FKBP-type peptidyl-prolyl cis-trans isomerase FklB